MRAPVSVATEPEGASAEARAMREQTAHYHVWLRRFGGGGGGAPGGSGAEGPEPPERASQGGRQGGFPGAGGAAPSP